MVPLENSVEGAIGVTLDELALGEPLVITGEVLLPVSFAVMARSGTALDDVRTIATHPHAAAQVRRWVAAKMPQAEIVAEASTAAAAASVAEGQYDAAIAAPLAADHYDLEILVDGIHDNDDAVTRFVLVSRTVSPPTATGGDRTSLAAFIADDHPGALLEILTQFSVRGINLTRIESRPTGENSAATTSRSTARGTSTTSALARRSRGCGASARTCGSSVRTVAPISHLATWQRCPPPSPTTSSATPRRGWRASVTDAASSEACARDVALRRRRRR